MNKDVNKEIGPQGEFDEVLGMYPDLARARELFINLFQDRTPLVNLGYTGRQIEFALPVLRLLEGEGNVKTYIHNNPHLWFYNPDAKEGLSIYHLPRGQGFYLDAERDGTSRGWGEIPEDQRLLRILYAKQPVVIFKEDPEQVAHVGLFEKSADINNLDYLIHELIAHTFTDAPLGMRTENPITKAAKAVGAAGTYRAAWVDERTKLEFVAKIDAPEDKKRGSVYVITYRKLKPIVDLGGSMTPIGKKANTSEERVAQILSAKNRQTVSGELARGNARA